MPSFICFIPTKELFDCERRAFFVNHSGPKALQNLTVVVKDEKDGSVQQIDQFRSGIEPGPQNPDALRYIWIKPSHPWDEKYTITVTGTGYRSVQEIALGRSKKDAQIATTIQANAGTEPLLSCRDRDLPDQFGVGRDAAQDCDAFMGIPPRILDRLESENDGFQQADGTYRIMIPRKFPSPHDLDTQSEDRHLTEYQRTIMKSRLWKYRGSKILILSTDGPRAHAYAREFRELFTSLGWNVEGPNSVPSAEQGIVDVQLSISAAYRNTPYPKIEDLQSSLAGIKHRHGAVADPDVPRDVIVLWVGPKSPNNFNADDCGPPAFRPKPGQQYACEWIAQTAGGAVCAFAPS